MKNEEKIFNKNLNNLNDKETTLDEMKFNLNSEKDNGNKINNNNQINNDVILKEDIVQKNDTEMNIELNGNNNNILSFEAKNCENNQKENFKEINEKDNIDKESEENNESENEIYNDKKDNDFKINNSNCYSYNTNYIEYNNNKYISNFELTKNIGFSNIGHTCYMNSFLQILLHVPSFLPKLKELYKNKIEKNTLIYNIIKLSEYPNDTKYLYDIKKIMSKINEQYGTFTQYDTQIFAIDLIATMINEIKNEVSESESSSQQEDNKLNIDDKAIKMKKFNKFISDYEKLGEKTLIEEFFSFIDYSIKSKNNFIDMNKIIYNSLLNIELSFPSNSAKNSFSLYELLDNKYHSNNINKNNTIDKKTEINAKNNKNKTSSVFSYFSGFFYTLFSCCKKEEEDEEEENKIQATKSNLKKEISNTIVNELYEIRSLSKIVTLPNILIISLNRGIEGKPLVSYNVSFDEALELKDYIDEDLYDIKLGTTYKLYAINVRQGSTIYSGHCYSYVKVDNDWVCFNDSYAHCEKPVYSMNAVVGLYYIKNNFK